MIRRIIAPRLGLGNIIFDRSGIVFHDTLIGTNPAVKAARPPLLRFAAVTDSRCRRTGGSEMARVTDGRYRC
jgi:hypothetical protein